MPLITDEATAVRVLANEMRRRGNSTGLANFARLTLGAHSEQARRLADIAEQVHDGADIEDFEFAEPEKDTVTLSKNIEGRTLNVELKADRVPITTFEELVEFYDIDLKRWRPTKQHFSFWGSAERPNFNIRASFEEQAYHSLAQEDREALREWVASIAPEPPTKPEKQPLPDRGNMLEIMIADLHAGKLAVNGEPIDASLERVKAAVSDIINRALHTTDMWGLDRIALVFNGDTFNDDNGKRTTTGGTPQESGERWQEVYRKVRELLVEVIRHCWVAADEVDVYIIEGNHDRERTFYLVDVLSAYFHKWEDVTVHQETLRNYIDWGVTTIGLAHGDEMKPIDLAMTILRETNTQGKHVIEWHLGHHHTRTEDEIHGVLLRRFRTPSPVDDYHNRKGFTHNARSVMGIVWNKERGEIASFPVTFIGDEA